MKKLGEIVIRPAQAGDEAGILGCLAEAFEPYRGDYTPAAYADTVLDESSLRGRLERMHVLVACWEDEVAGTVGASIAEGKGHLRGMAVLPGYRGIQLAARLLTAIESWLTAAGCKRVTLNTTLPLQAAMKFYEKNGYARSGRVLDFFGMPLVEYVKDLA
jgi:GNAT superfamily N-acetyltransferase